MPEGSLRVVTYNVWGTHTPGEYWERRTIVRGALPGSPAVRMTDPAEVWSRRAALLGAELSPAAPDLLALQESMGSQAGQLAAALSAPGRDYRTTPGAGGLALVSRLPVRQVRHRDLTAASGGYGGHAGLLDVTVSTPNGPLTVVVVHWPVGPEDVKVACAEEVLRTYQDRRQRLVICGDFNAHAGTAPMRKLLERTWLIDAWSWAGGDDGALSAPLPEPVMRLDHVLVGPPEAWSTASRAELLGLDPDTDGLFPSDHCGLSVSLQIG